MGGYLIAKSGAELRDEIEFVLAESADVAWQGKQAANAGDRGKSGHGHGGGAGDVHDLVIVPQCQLSQTLKHPRASAQAPFQAKVETVELIACVEPVGQDDGER
jgi:hypothetical protein